MLHRRQILSAAALGSVAFFVAPGLALANAPTERRFIFIIQRGAADGLDTVRPYADPAYAALRGQLLDAGEPGLKLDGTFALHPALVEIGRMYGKGEAAFVHAVASPYRDRSHFDGQNVLETGGTQPYAVKDGWLNRLVSLMPDADAIAIGTTIPMALRGAATVGSYAPSDLPEPSEDLMTRVARLYGADDRLHPLWSAAVDARMLAGGAEADQKPESIGRLAASFLSKPTGPRIATIETVGWDTHNAQVGRMRNQLNGLDRLVASLRDGLGADWANTIVLVATEFGRTAAMNGTGGTDHGTGSVAMILGGAVKGGRVVADWPGLAAANLYEGRDLKPTTPMGGVIAGVASEALGIDPQRVGDALFAGADVTKRISGLVKAGASYT
jgi:uncharacterized protein (DUF1501 family)